MLLALAGLLLAGGFVLARQLEPDPRGFGTHQRLGLPPCSFRLILDLPCPSCGMTTSFAHFVRGRFGDASRANFGGMLLASACALQLPWCAWSVWRGVLWKVHRPLETAAWVLLVIAAVCVLNWIVLLGQIALTSL